jgi:hypothetical protein
LRQLYKKADIFNKAASLKKRFQEAGQDDIREVIEDCIQLGTITGELMLSAGRKVSKMPYNNGKPFSDKLAQIAKTFRQKKNLLRYLIQKNENERNRDTETQVQMQIREAYLSLKEVQQNAEKERKSFLSKLADKRASEWNLSHNAALNVILQSEASKKTFARHGYVMTKQKLAR